MMLMERKFTWVLEEFSSSPDEIRYSKPFTLVGCNWRLVAYPKGDDSSDNNSYLCLYLELDPGSLPLGWCRDVEFSITLLNNKGSRRWDKVLGGRCCFTAKDNSWGFNDFLSLFKLRHTREGFLVNDRLVIIAEVHVLPAAIGLLSSQKGNQAFDAFVGDIPGDSSCQVEQKVESASKEDASEDDNAAGKGLNDHDEGLDDVTEERLNDDDKSEEGSGDDNDDASVNISQGDSTCQMEHKTENTLNEKLEDNDVSEEGSDDEEASEESSDDDDASEESSGNDNDYAIVKKSQGDSSCQMEQKTENAFKENLDDDNASEESSDDDDASVESSDDDDDDASEESWDDDDLSEESSDDDDASEESWDDDESSSHISDDGGREKCLLNQSIPLKDGSITVENPAMRCNNVASGEDPDDDDVSSLGLSVGDKYVSSLEKLKSMEDASQKVENGDAGCNNKASVTEASSTVLNEIQLVKETMDFNGFEIVSSELELVSHIFKRHPDIASGFRPKNQQIRTAYMNELRSLIEMLCQSPEKLSEDDLSNADDTLVDLTDVGFKLDWLKTKLNEISEKKKKEQASVAKIQTMEEEVQKLKLMVLNLESRLQKEKTEAEALAPRAPLSINDIIC